ncbi:prepilin-type cleavage/methylation domain-containing protein [Shewanella sp. 202IG2-18]|nr:prepilin-type cleavage/methylation domain-containing protein [Parashewanella hymeniacidonis]
MITVAILGILSSIAYPSYVDYVTRSARADALAGLVHVANLQEQYYLDHRTYTDDVSKLGLPKNSNDAWEVENKLYEISAATSQERGFVLTATAIGAQNNREKECKTITVDGTNKKGPENKDCWQ